MVSIADNSNNGSPNRTARRRAVLDLAPLELDCMNTLWPIGEGTVRDIRDRLAERRPRAYTTIMTIMDRLARKGIVERRKSGRAYIYRPHLTMEEARTQALAQVIDNFFSGSKEALRAQLDGTASPPVPAARLRAAAARAGAAATSGRPSSGPSSSPPTNDANLPASEPDASTAAPASESIVSSPTAAPDASANEPADRIDDTLL
jgi:BlaI family transcriptional regulator, penicillinase repressor